MSWSQTLDTAVRIKPEIIVQELSNLETIQDGMETKNVFKIEKNINDDEVNVRTTARDIMSIGYVGAGESGKALASPTYTDIKQTVPPMKAHVRIMAKALKKAARYKNQDFMTWLRENYLVILKEDIAYSLEYLKRHMLTSGNMAYPYYLNSGWTTANLTLGTALTSTASVKWDTAGTSSEDVASYIRGAIRTARATDGSYQYFQNAGNIKIYCPDAEWNYAYAHLEGRQSSDVVNTRIMSENEINVGGYTLTNFGAQWKSPQTGSLANAITDKTIRIIDVGPMAKHTLAFLELDNINAVGANKHVLIQVIPDEAGEYIDILVQFRPVPLINPLAMIVATVVA